MELCGALWSFVELASGPNWEALRVCCLLQPRCRGDWWLGVRGASFSVCFRVVKECVSGGGDGDGGYLAPLLALATLCACPCDELHVCMNSVTNA